MTHVVRAWRDARRDIEVPVLDGAALLAGEQVRTRGDGDVHLRLVRDEVDLEAIEAGRLVIARDRCALVKASVSGYLDDEATRVR